MDFLDFRKIVVWHLVWTKTNFCPEFLARPWTNIYLLVWQYFGLVEWRYLDPRLLVEHRWGSVKYLPAKIFFKNRPIRNKFSFEPIKNDQFSPMTVKKWSILNYKSIFLKSTKNFEIDLHWANGKIWISNPWFSLDETEREFHNFLLGHKLWDTKALNIFLT